MNLTDPVSILKGVGKHRYKIFIKNGITSIEDFLYYFPRRYLDRTNTTHIKDLRKGEHASIVARVESFSDKPIRRGKIFQVIVSDGSGLLTLSWFNSMQFLKKNKNWI